MKKFLLSSVAFLGLATGAMAADLPSRTMAPMAPISAIPVFTWTGFYIGAQVGYAWNDSDNELFGDGLIFDDDNDGIGTVFPGFSRGDGDGFMGGVHAGYNYQFGAWVVGIEGDIEGVFGDDDDDRFRDVVLFDPITRLPVTYAIAANTIDWQGSIRGRVGFAFDRAMIYATGGFAFAGASGSFGNLIDEGDDTITGWTLGAGVEYAFTNNLTTRLEYRYTSYDREGSVFNNVNVGGDDFDFHTVRLGLSYKF
jgi:outer membrane immunogenic protein